jgi:hypothetical protein
MGLWVFSFESKFKVQSSRLEFELHINTCIDSTVYMAEWLDGHLGSSRSRVETLLE